MKIIGITGGVGAGKSTVLEYLRGREGVRVVQADRVGHEVMAPGASAAAPSQNFSGRRFSGRMAVWTEPRLPPLCLQRKKS